MTRLKKWMLAIVLLLAFTVLAACSDSNDGSADATAPPSEDNDTPAYTGGEATIMIADVNTGIATNKEWVEQFFIQPVQEKFPEITVTMAPDSVQNMIKAGTPPDIVLVSNPYLHDYVELDLPEDLTEMISKYNVDLGAFEQVVIEEIRRLSDGGIYGLPFSMNYGTTIYNKDIFDRFGVEYPKDGMTWDEHYELARSLTRVDDGVQYYGLRVPGLSEWLRQYTVPIVNPETNQAELTTQAFIDVVAMLTKFYTIPGYTKDGNIGPTGDPFFKEQNTAMNPTWIAAGLNGLKNDNAYELFNWDLTTFPTLPDKPNVGKQVDFHMAVVNKASPNREAAYQLVLSIISEEVQSGLSRVGRLTPLNNEHIRGLFGSDTNIFEGKNLQGVFSVEPAPMPYISKFNSQIEGMLNGETMRKIVIDQVDINSALREAEERANTEFIIED